MTPARNRSWDSFLFRALPEADARRLGTPSLTVLGSTLRLVCWNIHKAQRPRLPADLALLCADADIVLLQEAVLHGGRADALHLNGGMEWVMAETVTHFRRATTSGVKTGCRATALDVHAYRSPDAEPILGTPKAILLTRYASVNGLITVVNVHAINFVTIGKFSRQLEQLRGIVAGERGPLIVGGDFNTWSPARRRQLLAVMAEFSLVHVTAHRQGRWQHFGQQLDHIFLRGVTAFDAPPLPRIVSSDHAPLRVDVAI